MASSVFFFAYTNFGVWLIGGLYPHTLTGLVSSYAMGLPFYRTMIIGNAFIVPLAIVSVLVLQYVVHSVDTRSVRAQS